MGPNRKNSDEARGPMVVVGTTASVAHTDQKQRGMTAGAGGRLQARRQVLQQIAPQYHTADEEHKHELLEAFVHVSSG